MMSSAASTVTGAPNTPPASFGDNAVAWAMWLYYAEGRTQNEVAQTLGVSRASVAQLSLRGAAPGPGLHQHSARCPGQRSTWGESLSERYGLAGAHVVPAER